MKKIQQWILPRQKMINQWLLGLELGIIVGWLMVLFMVLWWGYQNWLPELYWLGGKLGVVAVGLFVIVLMPGIIMRLKWWRSVSLPTATIITPFRRRLGVLMFIVAVVHMSFTTTLPYVSIMGFAALPPPFSPAEVFGVLAVLILTPVWLTSTDWWLKALGKWWKRVQRLSYVAIWAILVHLVLLQSSWSWLMAVIGVLELVSWARFYIGKRINPLL